MSTRAKAAYYLSMVPRMAGDGKTTAIVLAEAQLLATVDLIAAVSELQRAITNPDGSTGAMIHLREDDLFHLTGRSRP